MWNLGSELCALGNQQTGRSALKIMSQGPSPSPAREMVAAGNSWSFGTKKYHSNVVQNFLPFQTVLKYLSDSILLKSYRPEKSVDQDIPAFLPHFLHLCLTSHNRPSVTLLLTNSPLLLSPD